MRKKGFKHSEETKRKISQSKQGKSWGRHSDETKRKISESEKGKNVSVETRIKISNSYIKTKKRLRQITELGKSQAGKKSPHWKGGVSRAYKTGYWSIEYREWRKKVFNRDNYECQNCNQKRGRYITAHHIKSWRNYPELRYEVSNGITLCEKCHSETDNYKGRVIKSNN